MVSRRVLLGVLASGLAAPAMAWAEGDQPSILTRKGRRTRRALKTQASDSAALKKVLADVKPLEGDPDTVAATGESGPPPQAVSPDEALGRLKQGNAVFARGGAGIALPGAARIAEMATGQKPFAVIVGCSDSRVGPERIFDCNLGELFVVRVAGPTVGQESLGAIVHAVERLGAPLIVVLGHTRCDVVGTAVDVVTGHAHPRGALLDMVLPILPAVIEAQGRHPADLLDAAIRQNVRDIAARLKIADGVLAEHLGQGRLKVVSATYDLSTGQVAFDA